MIVSTDVHVLSVTSPNPRTCPHSCDAMRSFPALFHCGHSLENVIRMTPGKVWSGATSPLTSWMVDTPLTMIRTSPLPVVSVIETPVLVAQSFAAALRRVLKSSASLGERKGVMRSSSNQYVMGPWTFTVETACRAEHWL